MPGYRTRWLCRAMRVVALVIGCATAGPVRADQLSVEMHAGEEGYLGVEELSYEAIVEASSSYTALLNVRIALHNSSRTPRDAVHTLALPYASQLEAIALAKDGVWRTGQATVVVSEPARRDPGTVFAREIQAVRGGLPAVELVAFGLEPDITIQVELSVRVYPRLVGDMWELDLPSRGRDQPNLAGDRRILVKALPRGKPFFVDRIDNAGQPFLLCRPEDTVTVAWPATMRRRGALDGHYETSAPGNDSGEREFRLYLQLGPTKPARPDHLVVLVDRSLSTPNALQSDTLRMLGGLLDAVPGRTTYEVLAFNRRVVPVLGEAAAPHRADEVGVRARIAAALANVEPGQGTDLMAALEAAGRRTAVRGITLVVVVTDGMLPARIKPRDVRGALARGVGRRRTPEVLFVVDDPMLTRTGLFPDHRVARIAAGLGARISLKTLAQLGPADGAELLGAPGILGDLEIALPRAMTLERAAPSGLVSGNFVVLRGTYPPGRPPNQLKVSGNLGGRRTTRTLRRETRAPRPEALVAASRGDLTAAVGEGFVVPPWYRRYEQDTARKGVAQAGRFGAEKHGFLTGKIFRHYLTTRVLPRARVCYNQALARQHAQAGRVVLEMEVGKGEVMLARADQAELSHDDPKLMACMAEAAWALDIPAAKMDDQIYRLRYPLTLVPPKNVGGDGGAVVRISDEVMEVLLSAPPPPRG